MKQPLFFAVIAVLLLNLITPSTSPAASGLVKMEEAVDVLKAMTELPEKGVPPALLNRANGIAIIPGVIKAGFVIGGRYGTGVMVARGKDGGWTDPSFISIAGGSIGWQAGVESVDIILVFKNPGSIDKIMSGKFTLGADASIAAGPAGREAKAATDVELSSEIYSYSRSRGLFVGLSLEGASLQIDHEANEKFYGKAVTPRDITSGVGKDLPPSVDRLKQLLKTYSDK
ncbi:MAG: lipid-binding SYLF domain-containing protein [Nitrospirae bacterium]|nr:lipid-binding SYLF domain-containing protein [Nitrospirota bacterium]